jgi:hypothetical protein
MPDARALAAFADFMLVVAPRLLLYPGGLFAAACALVLVVALPRITHTATAAPGPPPAREGETLVALALAWTAWALLPLPAAPALPGAPDLLGPLALLLAATLLGSSTRPGVDWRREVLGRPLLLGAPLVALVALGAPGLLPMPPGGEVPFLAAMGRVLAGLAYVVGFCVCYAAPGTAPWTTPGRLMARAAGWMEWLGWLGLATALGPAARATAAGPSWTGPVLVAVIAAAAAAGTGTPVARALAQRGAPLGWLALGLGMLLVLLAGPA